MTFLCLYWDTVLKVCARRKAVKMKLDFFRSVKSVVGGDKKSAYNDL